MARLHVLLGGGGVGKTTLAAGYALALARDGRRVGLLGIDPSRRLHDALGLELGDVEADVPEVPGLRAAILHPQQALRRWAAEDCRDAAELADLERNPFFLALSDRLASAIDVLAAVRIVEWTEHDPHLDALVVDTAPGVAAVGFLQYPRDIERLLSGTLIGALRSAAAVTGGRLGMLRFGARRVLGAFGRIAGVGLVAQLADFFALATAPLQHMIARLQRAQQWLSAPQTELLLVSSPHDCEAAGASQIAAALRTQGLSASAAVVNRTWSDTVAAELAALPAAREPVVRHAQAYARAQRDVLKIAAALAPLVIAVPCAPELAAAEPREVLLRLGDKLLRPAERARKICA